MSKESVVKYWFSVIARIGLVYTFACLIHEFLQPRFTGNSHDYALCAFIVSAGICWASGDALGRGEF
jgi:hypothetical protein